VSRSRRVCLSSRRFRIVAGPLALVLGLSGLSVAAPAASGVTRANAASPTRVSGEPDAVSAQQAAASQGSRVEITRERTETTTSYANPDGTFTLESSAAPTRVMQGGSWAPVDTTLRLGMDGTVRPVATDASLALSGGGNASLATIGTGGKSLAMTWLASLPSPTLSGSTATYANVLPNTDLVVTSGVDSYEESLVVKAPPSHPLGTMVLPLSGTGLTFTQDSDGAIVGKDKSGVLAFTLQPPQMWDATVAPGSQGIHPHTGAVTMKVVAAGDGQALSVAVDTAFLTDAATVYPVTIDPTTTIARANWDWLDSTNPTTSYYNANDIARVGTWNSGTFKARSIFSFNLSKVVGTHIKTATLNTWEKWSASCTPSEVDVYETGPLSSTSNWNNTAWYSKYASATVAKGFSSSCPVGAVGFDIKTLMQYWANTNKATPTLGLHALSETDSNGYKSFDANPTISVDYNSYPSTPTSVTTAPLVTGTTGTPAITSTVPVFSASGADPDGGTTQVQFEVDYDPAFADGTGLIATGNSAFVTAGSTATWTPASGLMPAGKHIEWKARTYDGADFSAWSTWHYGVFNTDLPSAPVLACSAYPSTTWTASVGSTTCTVKDNDTTDVSGFLWSLDNKTVSITSAFVTGAAGGVTSNLSINPAVGWHTLYARAQDTAYNLSTTTTSYSFGVGVGGLTSPADGDTTQQAVTLTSAAWSGEAGVTYNYRLGAAGGWVTVPTGDVTIPGTSTHPTWPQSITGTSSALSWNIAATVTAASGNDGPIQLEACFSHLQVQDGCSVPETLTLARKTFGVADATTGLGPGTLSLLTGDLEVGAQDAQVNGPGEAVTFGRTLTTLGPSTVTSGPTGIFGPAWTANLPTPSSGHADETISSHPSQGFATLTAPAGVVSPYTTTDTAYPYTFHSVRPNGAGSTLVAQNSTTYVATDADGTATTWSWNSALSTWQVGSVTTPNAEPVGSGSLAATTSYSYDSSGRVTQILAPVPDGVTCTTPLTTKGCRTLTLSYATTTTATGNTSSGWGNYAGRITGVSYTAWDPATSQMKTTTVESYLYDLGGLLRAAWDPRISPALKTTYSYDTNNRLSTLTAPGLNGWTINYDTADRVASVAQTDPANGIATRPVAYGVPISGSGAPTDLSTSQTNQWAQTSDVPYTGTAIFPPDHTLSAPGSDGDYTPSSTDWPYASLTYLDVNGRDVNDASYGAGAWQIASTQYDNMGNGVWALTPANRAQALAPTSSTDPAVGALASSADRANALATISSYAPSATGGEDLIDTYGPTYPVGLDNGTLVDAREHTHNAYDQNQPTGTYDLLTTETVAASYNDGSGTATDHDVHTTQYGYAATGSGSSGWPLAQPTTTTNVLTSGNMVETTSLNPVGSVLTSGTPNANGVPPDDNTISVTLYTATSNTTYPECGSHPEWAGLTCRSGPAAQPSSGPVTPVSESTYTYLGDDSAVTETSGSVTRTTTTTYDPAGRPTQYTVTSNATDATVPTVSYGYDTSTGLTTTVSTSTQALTTGYDALGRTTTYTVPTATGTNTTSTGYDIDGRITSVYDGKGTTTYAYNGTDALGLTERRGLVTSENAGIGSLSTFTFAYDQDGNQINETYPNGAIAATNVDNGGQPVHLTQAFNGTTWGDYSQTADVTGVPIRQADLSTSQVTTPDQAGRPATIVVQGNGGCTTSLNTYDLDSNLRTSVSYPADTTGGAISCSTTTTASNSFSSLYEADQAITGVSNDALGRPTAIPAADTGNPGGTSQTVTYYADDTLHTQTQDGTTQTLNVDPGGRTLSQTDSASGITTSSVYVDGSSQPAWTSKSDGTWLRTVTDPDGSPVATQDSTGATSLILTDLAGDETATAPDTITPGLPSPCLPGPCHPPPPTKCGSAPHVAKKYGAALRKYVQLYWRSQFSSTDTCDPKVTNQIHAARVAAKAGHCCTYMQHKLHIFDSNLIDIVNGTKTVPGESHFKVWAKPPPSKNSTALGIGQLLNYNRATYIKKMQHQAPGTLDPWYQMAAMIYYIVDRYGTTASAWATKRSPPYTY
jgi:hypothetical protein